MVNYFNTLKNVIVKPLTMRQLPIHIQVEHTTYCNLNCKSCERSKFIEHPRHLSLEEFQRIIEQIRPEKITLGGVGEPFMHPQILDLVQFAKRCGCSINTTTNGTLLTPERCDQIVKSGLDLIKISIDGATRKTYQTVRGEDKFLQVVDGIRALADAKKRLDSLKPFIRFNYVMFKDNYQEIAEIVELADKLGVDAIYFQPLDLVGIEERHDLLVGDLTYADFAQEIRRALNLSRTQQVTTNLAAIASNLPTYWKKYQLETRQQDHRICILPWFSTYVTVDGIIRPCCSFSGTIADMGNILYEDIAVIWNSERYQQFRKAIRAGQRPYPICANCVPQMLGDIIKSSGILPGFF
jgi:radical SAM protein with 4Fe4S-binding SPASM domain